MVREGFFYSALPLGLISILFCSSHYILHSFALIRDPQVAAQAARTASRGARRLRHLSFTGLSTRPRVEFLINLPACRGKATNPTRSNLGDSSTGEPVGLLSEQLSGEAHRRTATVRRQRKTPSNRQSGAMEDSEGAAQAQPAEPTPTRKRNLARQRQRDRFLFVIFIVVFLIVVGHFALGRIRSQHCTDPTGLKISFAEKSPVDLHSIRACILKVRSCPPPPLIDCGLGFFPA